MKLHLLSVTEGSLSWFSGTTCLLLFLSTMCRGILCVCVCVYFGVTLLLFFSSSLNIWANMKQTRRRAGGWKVHCSSISTPCIFPLGMLVYLLPRGLLRCYLHMVCVMMVQNQLSNIFITGNLLFIWLNIKVWLTSWIIQWCNNVESMPVSWICAKSPSGSLCWAGGVLISKRGKILCLEGLIRLSDWERKKTAQTFIVLLVCPTMVLECTEFKKQNFFILLYYITV